MMFGMPRDASHARKLAIMLHHLSYDEEASDRTLLEDVCAASLDHLARRARVGLPVRMIKGEPLIEPDLRDAAMVMGAVWDAPRMARFARPAAMESYAHPTRPSLPPAPDT